MQPTDVIFKAMKEQGHQLGEGRTRRIFKDRNSKILFVAHLDTVCQPRMDKLDMQGRQHGAGFDDRLGCKIAWDLGIELGCDVLLTDLEESGDSTAQHHTLKNYNWICEFDRAGEDVVTYGMESERWLAVLGKYWKVNNGMFSDLSFMKTECCAMNLGISYQHAHSENSYYDVALVNQQVNLFRQFFKKQNRNKYVADPNRRDYCMSAGYGFGNYVGGYYEDEDEYGCCCVCGNWAESSIYELHLCESCVDRMVEAEIRI
jgi:hypothetical protein